MNFTDRNCLWFLQALFRKKRSLKWEKLDKRSPIGYRWPGFREVIAYLASVCTHFKLERATRQFPWITKKVDPRLQPGQFFTFETGESFQVCKACVLVRSSKIAENCNLTKSYLKLNFAQARQNEFHDPWERFHQFFSNVFRKECGWPVAHSLIFFHLCRACLPTVTFNAHKCSGLDNGHPRRSWVRVNWFPSFGQFTFFPVFSNRPLATNCSLFKMANQITQVIWYLPTCQTVFLSLCESTSIK